MRCPNREPATSAIHAPGGRGLAGFFCVWQAMGRFSRMRLANLVRLLAGSSEVALGRHNLADREPPVYLGHALVFPGPSPGNLPSQSSKNSFACPSTEPAPPPSWAEHSRCDRLTALGLLRRRLGVPPRVCGTSVMARLLSEHCQTTLAPMLVPQTAESLRHYTLSFTGPSPAVSSGPSPACSDFSRSTLFLPFPPSLLQHHFALSKLFLWWLRHCAPPFSGRGRRTLEVTTPTALLGVLPPAATLLLPHPSSKSHRLLLPPTVSPWAKPCPSLSQALGTPDLIFGLPFSKPSRP